MVHCSCQHCGRPVPCRQACLPTAPSESQDQHVICVQCCCPTLPESWSITEGAHGNGNGVTCSSESSTVIFAARPTTISYRIAWCMLDAACHCCTCSPIATPAVDLTALSTILADHALCGYTPHPQHEVASLHPAANSLHSAANSSFASDFHPHPAGHAPGVEELLHLQCQGQPCWQAGQAGGEGVGAAVGSLRLEQQ